MTRVAVILLAAGASSRMRGGDKLLEQVDGEALLRRQARATSAVATVFVTLPQDRPQRLAALAGLDVNDVRIKDTQAGMSASIKAGVAHLKGRFDAAILLPADMPDIGAPELTQVIAAHAQQPDRIVRGASQDGQPGHPVLFPKRLFTALQTLRGDSGARDLLPNEDVALVPLPGLAALTDLDTPEDWTAWRAQR